MAQMLYCGGFFISVNIKKIQTTEKIAVIHGSNALLWWFFISVNIKKIQTTEKIAVIIYDLGLYCLPPPVCANI